MERLIIKDLNQWAKSSDHPPLILRGARQVGKTYLIREFASALFEDLSEVNFEINSQFKQCFQELKPEIIIENLELILRKKIIPGKSLLLLDEIQLCPRAIQSLRYFKENMPSLHIIAAGSLLEFSLNATEFSMPVGRVTFRYLYPLSFQEFLLARKEEHLISYLKSVTATSSISPAVHDELLKLVKLYCMTGGMPAVVENYLREQNWQKVMELQSSLLQTYRDDFPKYAKSHQFRYLERIFERAPLQLGKRFKFSEIDPDLQPRELRIALELLKDAGILKPIHATSASGIPLALGKNEKKFKLAFLDLGLAQRACGIDLALLWRSDLIQINQGAFMEQFVAQELVANAQSFEPASLFYWDREKKNSMAEVDFVIYTNNKILPLEVKAGKTGRLKSLQVFMQEINSSLGIRISSLPLNITDKILSIPFYLISELSRIVEEIKLTF